MHLIFETLSARLAASALISVALLALMVQGWTALSQVKENLVTDWWEAPGLSAEPAPEHAPILP
jgi:hypothetical protein